ncbi:MAG TPA: Trk system potassium transporter TrkA [Acidimicrobiaceae bacterium]|nr:Trk system potassium transporter TrkA [Acidimicrobiaceae bacterium]HCV35012.1 Trk system potassium transporter TrkA [Acidimicrobiaceae bacterium]
MRDDPLVKIIVVGAGEVGTYVADRLSSQNHDVALIELNGERYRQLEQEMEGLDVLKIHGSGTDPDVLHQARVEEADLLVAVTHGDEINILCALLARNVGVKKTVVRVESRALRRAQSTALFADAKEHLVIDPDEEVAQAVLSLLAYPGALEVNEMAGGEVVVLSARLPGHAPLVGESLRNLGQRLEPDWDFIVGSITRRNPGGEEELTIIPRGDWTLREADLLTVICKKRALESVTEDLGLARDMPENALLLGGGRTAEMLAKSLIERGLNVAIIEKREKRAAELVERLGVLVYPGDITDASLLDDAGVAKQRGVVVALTGHDDANVLACLYAKEAGRRVRGEDGPETIAVVHRLQLLDLLEAHQVDATISPRTAMANSVLRFVRGKAETVAEVATSLHGDAEVLEFAVAPGCACDGRAISELGLHEDVLIGAIIRDGKPQIARGRSTLRARDHVVAVVRPGQAERLSELFV